MEDFVYAGIETCAVDGLCATACPVNINTGKLTKRLRAESIKSEKAALWVSDHFMLAENAIGLGVRLGHVAEKVVGAEGVTSISKIAEKLTGRTLPKWNHYIPFPSLDRRETHEGRAEGEKLFIYFPSCISRQLGTPKSDSHLAPLHSASGMLRKGDCHLALSQVILTIAARAHLALQIPPDREGNCCGMPFASKGFTAAYKATLHKTLLKFWEWSEHGEYPIVIDSTSCAHTLRTCAEALSSEDLAIYNQLTILDNIEFLHDIILPSLEIHPVEEDVILHPNCSARKLGLDSKLLAIAQKCARSATVPLNLGCCAFAGDRGLLFPELTASATEKESAEVNKRDYGGYYSSNIPCEIGMSEATGKNYMSIVYLVERASR
jgi:D-lactate dehydrogenase